MAILVNKVVLFVLFWILTLCLPGEKLGAGATAICASELLASLACAFLREFCFRHLESSFIHQKPGGSFM